MTLSELGEKTGIDVSTLSRYEAGKQSPSVERAFAIASALDVSLEDLMQMEHLGGCR